MGVEGYDDDDDDDERIEDEVPLKPFILGVCGDDECKSSIAPVSPRVLEDPIC